MDVDVARINSGSISRGKPKTGSVKKVKTGITSRPPAEKREPLANKEIFQGLDEVESDPAAAADPFAPPPDAGAEPSIDLDSLDMVSLDNMDGPGEPVVDEADDMELDLEQHSADENAFLSCPEPEAQKKERNGDPFAPSMDDADTPMAMLDVADDPFIQGGKESGRHERVTGPQRAVRRSSGSAAFEGEQDTEFHRAAIQALLVLLFLGAVVAIWPERYKLWSAVSGDYSMLNMLPLTTVPRDAKVYVNGRLEQSRPIRYPGDLEALELRVQAPGYVTKKQTVKSDAKGAVKIVLKKH